MERSIQLFAVIHLLLMGLSHVLHSEAWTEFFPLLLTLLGWAYMLKATIVFLLPRLGERSLAFVRAERPRMFVVPGMLLTSAGLALGYDLLR